MHSLISSTTFFISILATTTLANPQYGSASDSESSSTTTASASTASNIHSVQVGEGGTLTFTPDTVMAAEGDWIEFTFNPGHSVAQSSFDAPCVPISGATGVYSGFPNGGDKWSIQINSTDPLWLYCSATGHCEGGMALVVNPPSSGNTLDAYKAAAANAQGSSPQTVQGGVFGDVAATTTGSDSSSSASATESSATATATSDSGNGAGAKVISNGLIIAGAVAAGVAAVL